MPSVQSFKSAKTSYSLRGFGHGSDTVAIHGHSTDNLAYSIRCDSDTTLANSEVSDRGEGFMRQKSQANIKSRSGESINSVGYSFSTSTLNNSNPECSASADSKIDMNDSSTSYESNRSRRFSRSYSWSSKFSPKAKSIRSFSMSASDTSVDSRFDSRNHHESDTKVYKKLKSQLNKYKNKYGAGKTNHLRITLLTFLRETFFKGLLFPLLKDMHCTSKEAIILSSVLSKTSIPLLHSAAALLYVAEFPYNPANTIIVKTLLDKKYALPYKVVDAVVFHFVDFRNYQNPLPLVWHQSLLCFAQRYKNDITTDQRDALMAVARIHTHHAVTPEIRRELLAGEPRMA